MTRWQVTIEVPLLKPLPNPTNLREHRMVRAKRVKGQREVAALFLRTKGAAFFREWRVMVANERLRLGVTFTRISPRELDQHDNLRAAFKAIADQVAVEAGINDKSKRFEWTYAQEKGPPGYRVHLEVLQPEVLPPMTWRKFDEGPLPDPCPTCGRGGVQ